MCPIIGMEMLSTQRHHCCQYHPPHASAQHPGPPRRNYHGRLRLTLNGAPGHAHRIALLPHLPSKQGSGGRIVHLHHRQQASSCVAQQGSNELATSSPTPEPGKQYESKGSTFKGFGAPPQTQPKPKAKAPRHQRKESELQMQLTQVQGEAFKALGDAVSKLLGGVSVYLVGGNGDANAAVAEELAPALGYTPLQTASIIRNAAGRSLGQVVTEHGQGELTDLEASVLEQLSVIVRVCVGTLGLPACVAADSNRWHHIHGAVTIWLDCGEAGDGFISRPQPVSDAVLGFAQADACVRVRLQDAVWTPTAARPAAQGVLESMKQLLQKDDTLPGKKMLYVRLGCRGDWPDIQPPGWDPGSVPGDGDVTQPAAATQRQVWVGDKEEVEKEVDVTSVPGPRQE